MRDDGAHYRSYTPQDIKILADIVGTAERNEMGTITLVDVLHASGEVLCKHNVSHELESFYHRSILKLSLQEDKSWWERLEDEILRKNGTRKSVQYDWIHDTRQPWNTQDLAITLDSYDADKINDLKDANYTLIGNYFCRWKTFKMELVRQRESSTFSSIHYNLYLALKYFRAWCSMLKESRQSMLEMKGDAMCVWRHAVRFIKCQRKMQRVLHVTPCFYHWRQYCENLCKFLVNLHQISIILRYKIIFKRIQSYANRSRITRAYKIESKKIFQTHAASQIKQHISLQHRRHLKLTTIIKATVHRITMHGLYKWFSVHQHASLIIQTFCIWSNWSLTRTALCAHRTKLYQIDRARYSIQKWSTRVLHIRNDRKKAAVFSIAEICIAFKYWKLVFQYRMHSRTINASLIAFVKKTTMRNWHRQLRNKHQIQFAQQQFSKSHHIRISKRVLYCWKMLVRYHQTIYDKASQMCTKLYEAKMQNLLFVWRHEASLRVSYRLQCNQAQNLFNARCMTLTVRNWYAYAKYHHNVHNLQKKVKEHTAAYFAKLVLRRIKYYIFLLRKAKTYSICRRRKINVNCLLYWRQHAVSCKRKVALHFAATRKRKLQGKFASWRLCIVQNRKLTTATNLFHIKVSQCYKRNAILSWRYEYWVKKFNFYVKLVEKQRKQGRLAATIQLWRTFVVKSYSINAILPKIVANVADRQVSQYFILWRYKFERARYNATRLCSSTFRIWHDNCQGQPRRVKTRRKAIATKFYMHKTVLRTFKQWTLAIKHIRLAANQKLLALALFRRQQTQYGIKNWIVVKDMGMFRKAKVIEHHCKMNETRNKFHSWRIAYVSSQCQLVGMQYYNTRKLQYAIKVWHQVYTKQYAKKKAQCIADEMAHRHLLSMGFCAFLKYRMVMLENQNEANRCRTRNKLRFLRRVLYAWCVAAKRRRTTRFAITACRTRKKWRTLNRAISSFSELILHKANAIDIVYLRITHTWFKWRNHYNDRSASAWYRHRFLLNRFILWGQETHIRKKVRYFKTKAIKKQLKCSIYHWVQCCLTKRMHDKYYFQIRSYSVYSKKLYLWTRWCILQHSKRKHRRFVWRKYFYAWMKTACVSAITQRKLRIRRMYRGVNLWFYQVSVARRRRSICLAQRSYNIQAAIQARRKYKFNLKLVFSAWKDLHTSHVQYCAVLHEYYSTKSISLHFAAWQVEIANSARILKFVAVLSRRIRYDLLHSWRKQAHAQRSIKNQFRTWEERRTRNVFKAVLKSWVFATKVSRHEKCVNYSLLTNSYHAMRNRAIERQSFKRRLQHRRKCQSSEAIYHWYFHSKRHKACSSLQVECAQSYKLYNLKSNLLIWLKNYKLRVQCKMAWAHYRHHVYKKFIIYWRYETLLGRLRSKTRRRVMHHCFQKIKLFYQSRIAQRNKQIQLQRQSNIYKVKWCLQNWHRLFLLRRKLCYWQINWKRAIVSRAMDEWCRTRRLRIQAIHDGISLLVNTKANYLLVSTLVQWKVCLRNAKLEKSKKVQTQCVSFFRRWKLYRSRRLHEARSTKRLIDRRKRSAVHYWRTFIIAKSFETRQTKYAIDICNNRRKHCVLFYWKLYYVPRSCTTLSKLHHLTT